MEIPILTVLTAIPLVTAVCVWLFGGNDAQKTRLIAFTGVTSVLVLAFLGIYARFETGAPGIQFEERYAWISSINVLYHLGVDGLSMAMVLLVAVIGLFVVLASWDRNGPGLKNFYGLILLEQFGLLGAFTALDFFHWFIFWEFSLVPMFFFIKLFGHENKTAAAYKFFIYTMVGSVFLVLGFQFIYLATHSWNFLDLAERARTGMLREDLLRQWETITGGHRALGGVSFPLLIALFVMAGFIVKVPVWPFHTWLPPAYTQAPTEGSILLTALMSKMGVYGFLRIVLPLFHDAVQAMLLPLTWLAVASILFGALAAFAQRDLKTLVAYSSLSHLGYCMLGVFTATAGAQLSEDRIFALNGVVFQMVAHGLSAAGLFYFVGLLEKRCTATGLGGSQAFHAIDARAIDTYGGIRQAVPVFTGLMGITIFASLGLPGLCGFVGEFMIFKGSFSGTLGLWPYLVLAAIGLLLTAVYLLSMAQKVFFGPLDPKWSKLPDLQGNELWVVSAPLVALMFLIGIFPALVVNLSNSTVSQLAKLLG